MTERPRSDTLNEVGVLKRREIEARIVAPLLERLAAEYGEGVYQVAGDAIVEVAREQGAALADLTGDTGLPAFAQGLAAWSADGALESEIVESLKRVYYFSKRIAKLVLDETPLYEPAGAEADKS